MSVSLTISKPGNLSLSGSGFSLGGAVAFNAYLPNGSVTFSQSGSADNYGNISMTIPVSQSTIDSLSSYPYVSVSVTDNASGKVSNSVQIAFSYPVDPVIVVSPTSISQPQNVSVTGTGFSLNGAVAFNAQLPNGSISFTQSGSADSSGNINMVIPVSQSTIDSLSSYPEIAVFVQDSSTGLKSNTVNMSFIYTPNPIISITGTTASGTSGTTGTSSSNNPATSITITASTTNVLVGNAITISGYVSGANGAVPNTEVDLINKTTGNTTIGATDSGGNYQFTVTFSSAGTYSLFTSSGSVSSNPITVIVSTSPAPPVLSVSPSVVQWSAAGVTPLTFNGSRLTPNGGVRLDGGSSSRGPDSVYPISIYGLSADSNGNISTVQSFQWSQAVYNYYRSNYGTVWFWLVDNSTGNVSNAVSVVFS